MRALPALLPFVVAVLPSCAPGPACTDLAAVSLTLTVKNEAGAVITEATGRWTGEGRTDDCNRIEDDLLCGYEVGGALSVVVAAPGYQSKTVTATILSDECHVIGQQQDVVLTHLPD